MLHTENIVQLTRLVQKNSEITTVHHEIKRKDKRQKRSKRKEEMEMKT